MLPADKMVFFQKFEDYWTSFSISNNPKKALSQRKGHITGWTFSREARGSES